MLLEQRHDFGDAVRWHRLNEEMNVVLVRPYLQKLDLVAFCNLKADLFQNLINPFVENRSPTLCRKHHVVHQHRHVVALVNVFAHPRLRRKRRGIRPVEIEPMITDDEQNRESTDKVAAGGNRQGFEAVALSVGCDRALRSMVRGVCLSPRNLEKVMAEQGIEVDHSIVHRWVIKLVLLFEKAFRQCKRPVGRNWRMHETYVKVKGQWKHLYRAVDRQSNTVDFPLRAHRDRSAAHRYFKKAIDQNGEPETITVGRSGVNLTALDALKAERPAPIRVRQNRYLNNLVEQDHRAIKHIIPMMMCLKNFRCARHHPRRRRVHVHDPQEADADETRHPFVRGRAVLLTGDTRITNDSG
jgi:putative transposase